MEPARTIGDWANAISAVAAAVNTLLVAALVYITWRYARSTHEILEESRKARQAAELQVKAAHSQAIAAQAQASAANQTVNILKQQMEDQLGLGRGIVEAAIDSAVSAVEYWRGQDLKGIATIGCLPPTDNLIPTNASSALEHARRISPDVAQQLSSAFDDLRNTQREIESLRQVDRIAAMGLNLFGATSEKAQAYLVSAMAKLVNARRSLSESQ